jgi:hypothetical protein
MSPNSALDGDELLEAATVLAAEVRRLREENARLHALVGGAFR